MLKTAFTITFFELMMYNCAFQQKCNPKPDSHTKSKQFCIWPKRLIPVITASLCASKLPLSSFKRSSSTVKMHDTLCEQFLRAVLSFFLFFVKPELKCRFFRRVPLLCRMTIVPCGRSKKNSELLLSICFLAFSSPLYQRSSNSSDLRSISLSVFLFACKVQLK